MSKIPYVNYSDLEEFYTLKQLTKMFGMTKDELKGKCEQYSVKPRRNEIGDWGLVKYDVRKLHNLIYHESDNSDRRDDPWA